MVRGAQANLGAEVAVAVTGIAGPGGGTPEKPVGTVWFAFAVGERVESVMGRFAGSRGEIRARAAQAALMGVYRRVGDW
jgi:nicotinamide-nucleotide amidase